MPPSDPSTPTLRARLIGADWRGWFALAWVVWFGLLYGRTVIERRGPKLRAALAGLVGRAEPGPSLRR